MSASASAAIKARWLPQYNEKGALLPVRQSFHRMLDAYDKLHAKRAEISKDLHLNDAGKKEAARKFAATEMATTVARAAAAIKRAEARMIERRAALLPHVADTKDVAGAIRRSEIRGILQEMKPAQRIALLFDPAADARLIEAVVELPVAVAGITPDQHAKLINSVIQRTRGAEAAALAEEQEALEVAQAAMQIANNSLVETAALPPGEFATWFQDATADVKEDLPEDAAVAVDSVLMDARKMGVAARISLIDSLIKYNSDELAGKVAA